MRSLLVLFVVALGCGKGSASASAKVNPCERLDTMCHAGFDAKDLKECTAQLPDVIGNGWDAFVSCTASATACLDVLQCAAGSLDERGRKLLDKLARGHGTSHVSDDDALPAPCARANAVCADDEPFARRECARLAGNLKADAEHTSQLIACYGAAKNCWMRGR